jgi:peptide/nickel transport system permease protein
MRRLVRNRLALFGLTVVVAFLLVAVLAPVIAPYAPREQDYSRVFEGPSRDHWFGTDQLGRDWFSWIVYGTRVSMTVGIFAQVVILLIAIPIGAIAGSSPGSPRRG